MREGFVVSPRGFSCGRSCGCGFNDGCKPNFGPGGGFCGGHSHGVRITTLILSVVTVTSYDYVCISVVYNSLTVVFTLLSGNNTASVDDVTVASF